jgi:hypothetical protein
MKTQLEMIKNHLEIYGNITSLEAITHYRITRLSHYIYLLRGEGKSITSERVENNGKNFVNYIYVH